MTILVRGNLLAWAVASVFAANARADDWTNRKDVARSAEEFAAAAEQLQKAIKGVDEKSPLVAQVRSLSVSAAKLDASVTGGATYADAKRDFRSIEAGYARFEEGLKKAHDVHHEKPVADAALKVKSSFDKLQAHMSGRRPAGGTDQANPRPSQEDNR